MLIMKNTDWIKPLFALFIIALLYSCGNDEKQTAPPQASVEKTETLLNWFGDNGNFINSQDIPSVIDAQVVYAKQNENILVIDLRPEAMFNEGHIQYAINLPRTEILHYFRYSIDPSSFENIIIVCNNGNVSGYVAAILRLLGFDNVYNLRFGMSSWDKTIAERFWLANISDTLTGKMDFTSYPKAEACSFPSIVAEGTTGFEIAWERAEKLIAEPMDNFSIALDQIDGGWDKYYVMCYWPEEKYTKNGHLPGATQYTPKKSLHKAGELNTVPRDKSSIIYCYSGQHSVFVAAYLRMLGYDAKSLVYGANGFIHSVMAQTEPRPTRTFTEKLIFDLPLVKGGQLPPVHDNKMIPTETTTVAGGC
jgi:rhodanese-related sulfurtransferase